MLESPEFWVAVGFVILVAGIARPVARSMAAGLDARADRIRNEIDQATKLREEAQHLLAEYQRKQRSTAKEIEEMIAHAEAEATNLANEAAARLDGSLARREQMASEKIALAEANAVTEIRNAAVDVAIAAARDILATRLDASRSDALVDSAIGELPNRLR